MSIDGAHESRRWLSPWTQLRVGPTPLTSLPGMAASLGIAELSVKDESLRSPLGSFKALGAPVALMRLLTRLMPERAISPLLLIAGHYRASLAGLTVISATDGNHGRALAAAADSIGCACVIVLHAKVSMEREDAIAACGASIVRVDGNYDDSVQEAARLAAQHGWHVVSDTSYGGYEEIPRDVMQGYAIIAAEIVDATDARPGQPAAFTHLFLQGGVGGLAAGIGSYLWEFFGAQRPRMVMVEPEQADCLFQSALQGRLAKASGSVDSVMAGLACGEVSPLAWRFLEQSIDAFMTVDDGQAVAAMQMAAAGMGGDMPLLMGESGAAGLAGLAALRREERLSLAAGLDRDARVLVLNTEGATAAAIYQQLVGEAPAAVLARQRAWQAARR